MVWVGVVELGEETASDATGDRDWQPTIKVRVIAPRNLDKPNFFSIILKSIKANRKGDTKNPEKSFFCGKFPQKKQWQTVSN